MTERSPTVVVYVNGSYPESGAAGADLRSGKSPHKGPGPTVGGSALMAAHLETAVPLAMAGRGGAAKVPAGPAPRPATVFDPVRVHRDFPDRWRAYIRANFRSLAHVCQVFGVSERTARKWFSGETGANGGHVAVAMRAHPEVAPQMLFAAE